MKTRQTRRSRTLRAAGLIALGAAFASAPAVAEAATYTVKTSGRTVGLESGDRLVVDVAENPSTGYGWKTLNTPGSLKRVSSTYTPAPAKPGVAGAGGRLVLVYRVRRAGTGTLKLVYRRSFAPSASDRTVTVHLRARRSSATTCA